MSATLTSTGLSERQAAEGSRRRQKGHLEPVVAVQCDDGLPGGDLGERFDLDAGDGAGERGEQLAAIKGVACQLHLPACLIELRPGG